MLFPALIAGTLTLSGVQSILAAGGPPIVSAVDPNHGVAVGGTYLTIYGSGFTGATAVNFGGGVACQGFGNFFVQDDNHIFAISPPGTAGSAVDVTVVTSVGTSVVSSADRFSYTTAPVPAINWLTPSIGPPSGATTVTINGSGLTAVTAVNFGTTPALGFFVNTDTSITAGSPPGAAGTTVDVTVVSPGGTSATSAADKFRYATLVPTVNGVSPNRGIAAGGTPVTIYGSGFSTGTLTVHFGATIVQGAYAQSDTQLQVTSPHGVASGTPVDVTVSTTAGTSPISNADRFTYLAAGVPVVNGVGPNHLPAGGAQFVAIVGSGFTGATAVHFGSAPATNLFTSSDNFISVTAPAGAAGTTVDVTVTTSAGTSATGPADHASYIAASNPSIDAVESHSGPASGGSAVQIYGIGFTGATAVHFGAVAATQFSVQGDSFISATSPAGSVGATVDVTVTTPIGTSALSPVDHFTYLAGGTPAIDGVSPNQGSMAGGTFVTIFGTGFSSATAVHFGTTLVPAGSFNVFGDTQMEATSPAGSVGLVDITVTTPAGTSVVTNHDHFSYVLAPVPAVSAVGPGTGPAAGGTTVYISGSGLTGATAVHFGTALGSFFSPSDNVIQATTPGGTAGATVHVTVTTPGGTSATSTADQFTYATSPVPTVTAVSPSSGSSGGGTTVYISGSGIAAATAVKFGTASAGFSTGNDNVISATSPPGAAGSTVDITVTTAGGTSAISSNDHFSYVSITPPQPTVTAVSPSSGPSPGGTTVFISGTGLTGSTGVKFGTTAANFFQVLSDNLIQANSAAGTNGATVDVTVVTPGGTSATSANDHFSYTAPTPPPVPVVTAVSPNSGSAGGGLVWVDITGSGLSGATGIKFGTSIAGSFQVVSDNVIQVASPAGTSGTTVDVVVTTAGGTSVTSVNDQFTYTSAPIPVVTAVSPTSGRHGTTVYISGTGFSGATAVKFGTTSSTFGVVNDELIQMNSETGTAGTTVDVTVTTPGGTSATSANDTFMFVAPPGPSVTAVSPNIGLPAGGTTVYVSGKGLTGATGVNFGTTAASFQVLSDTLIQAASPAETAGTVDITVVTPVGTSATGNPDKFTYGTPPPPSGPVVNAVNPNHGAAGGGTSVTIYGSGFTGATGVQFGAAAGTGLFASGDNFIFVTSPAGAASATVDVTVTTAGGTSVLSAADQFTYGGAPVVDAVSPSRGSAGGGANLTIFGSGFTGTTSVKFGSGAGINVFTSGDNQIFVNSPSGVAGTTVDVTVTTPAGTSAVGNADKFSYLAAGPPVVNAVSPNRGPSGGGTGVLILGSGLAGATSVHFGTTTAGQFIVQGDGEIQLFSAPAGTAGTAVDVTVTTPLGTSTLSTADRFSYFAASPPVVNAVSPNRGTTGGGNSVTIYGAGFTGVTSVQFGGAVTTQFYLQGDSQIYVFSAPPGTSGSTVDVTVTTPAGTSATTNADKYSYLVPGPPVVNGVTPSHGSALGGTAVTIYGSGFTAATAVQFGTSATGQFTVSGDTQIYVYQSPPGAAGSTVDITVTTAIGTSSITGADHFTYVAPSPPTIYAASPNRGSAAGGASVNIFGAGFTGATAVRFGNTAASGFYVSSDGLIYATSPVGTAGTVDITVTTAAGVSGPNNADHFTYFTPQVPVVTAVSPGSGTSAGENTVFVSGSGFSGLTAVTFGGACAFNFYSVGDNLIQVFGTPPGTAGTTVDVAVTTPGGTSSLSSADHYSYTAAPVPAVTGIAPSSGPSGGGTFVFISGSGFNGATLVMFGSTPVPNQQGGGGFGCGPQACPGFFVVSDDLIEATNPPGASGSTVDVTVITPGGTSAVAGVDRFSYTPTPVPSVSLLSPNAGPSAGGTTVLITGSGFSNASKVLFGTVSAGKLSAPRFQPARSGPTVQSGTSATPNLVRIRVPLRGAGSNARANTPGGGFAISTIQLPARTATPHTGAATTATPRSGPATTGKLSSQDRPNAFGCFGFCPSFFVYSDDLIQATSPAGASGATVDVTVVSAGGTSPTSAADHFTYNPTPAPTVTVVSPPNGPFAGGAQVYVTGTNFTGASAVNFVTSTTTKAPFSVIDDDLIQATSPLGTNGATADVTVTTSSGTSATSAADHFSYGATPVPVVTAVNPSAGPPGTPVFLTGSGFNGATAVHFGATSVPSTKWVVINDSVIQVSSPTGITGTVDVTVTTPGGTSATSVADHYIPSASPVPVVGVMSPNSGPTAGGTIVYVTGTGLTGATAVSFGATSASSVVVHSDTMLQATSPAGSGSVHVTVTTPGGTSATGGADQFTYGTPPTLPVVTGVSPSSGPEAGGTRVTITGTALTGATVVKFGSVQASNLTVTSDTQIMATAPAGTGTVDITVTTAAGTSTTSNADRFVYLPALAVLPVMLNGAYGGYVTAAYLQNVGTAPAAVVIRYFDSNGNPVGQGDAISNLPVNGNWTVRQDNGNSFPSTGTDAQRAGSAIIFSNQPLAGFVNEFPPGGTGDGSSYTAVPLAGGTGPTLYAPAIYNDAYGGYTTGMNLINLSNAATTVSVTYRDQTGAVVKTQPLGSLPAHAYLGVYSGSSNHPSDANLPDQFAGTATVSSTGGALALTVNAIGSAALGNGFGSYDGMAAPSSTLYFPAALNHAYGGYSTGMNLQNTTGNAGTVTVTYTDVNGVASSLTKPIAPNGYLSVYQGGAPDAPPPAASDNGYTAVLTTAGVNGGAAPQVVAEVNEVNGSLLTSYNAFTAGSAAAHAALVENGGSDGWTTGVNIMNLSSSATTVTITYYDAQSGTLLGSHSKLLNASAAWGVYQGDPTTVGLPAGTRATAVVTTSGGGQVAVIVNEVGPPQGAATTFMSYGGQ